MKRFVVTGASGFIGRHLCAALGAHGHVVALVRNPAQSGPWQETVVCDLSRDELSPRVLEGADVVFHLAGRAHAIAERKGDVAAYGQVNVEGTRRVAQAARAAGVRCLVFAGSVKAMGEGNGEKILSPYGQSKLDAEAIVREAGFSESVVLRLSLVYGAGVGGNLGSMLRAIRAHRFPPPPLLHNRRAMVHVDDVVRVLVAAGETRAAAGRTFVVGDGVEYSTRGIYDAMRVALGLGTAAWSLPAPCWRALAHGGDALGFITRRRAPFDGDAYRKLFASAWYQPSDLQGELGLDAFLTLADALPAMVAAL